MGDDDHDDPREGPAGPGGAAPAPILPVVWLLGKTGAGKSSLVRALTGLDAIEVGTGFRPCTRNSMQFDFPPQAPVMRFLDTRGLGEVGYDPAEDIAQSEGHAHAVLVVARLDDPVQGEVAAALRAVRRARPSFPGILVMTGADLVPDAERERAIGWMRDIFREDPRQELPEVVLSLDGGADEGEGLDRLLDHLSRIMPEVALLLARGDARTAEEARFQELRPRILRFCMSAAGADMTPLVGAVAAPAIQGAMLEWLARQYGLVWSRRLLADLLGLLGAGIALRFGVSYGLRQAFKLVPIAGQTAGAAASGAVAFAATYALGRAGCYYLHGKSVGARVDPGELRRVYADAMTGARRGGSSS